MGMPLEPAPGLSVQAQLQALHRLALALGHPGGPDLYDHLVRELADALKVAAVFAAVFADRERTTMRSLAGCLDGRMLPPFEYPLAGSPCEKVTGKAFRYMPGGVRAEMPPDEIFALAGMDSYAAFPLNDSNGEALGLVASMDRRPIANGDAAQAEAILKIVAVRLVAEIERSRADEALQRSAASYRAIFEATEDAVFIHDWDSGRILDANPKACATYGYTRDELMRLSVAELSSGVPPYTLDDAIRWLALAKDNRCPPVEWHRRNKDGSLHWDEVRLKPVTIDGRPHILAVTREVTERKAALQALQAREEQYRAVFDGSVDPIVLWNRRLEVVDVNAAFLRTTGFTRDDVVGRHWSERADADDLRKLMPLIEGALAGREGRAVERVARADGSLFDIELRYLPVTFAGEPHALGIGRDISQSVQAERALRDSEAQYRAIFNASADVLTLWNSQYRRVDVNPAYERLYGWKREEVVGRGFDFPPYTQDHSHLREELLKRALAGETVQAEHDVMTRSGERRHAEVTAIPFRHEGEPHVLVITRDITERKRAEVGLRASEEQYRAIFNASADALVLRDAGFRIVDVNATYETMSGYSRAEVLGLDRVLANPPEAGLVIRALHEQALRGEAIVVETQLLRRDGRCYELELRGVPIRHRGEPHVLYMGRDITARRRADEALRDSEAQYRAIFSASADGLVLRDADFRIVDVNPAYLAMSGYTREETLGATHVLTQPMSENDACVAAHAKVLSGELLRLEATETRKDGSTFISEVRGMPAMYRGRPHVLYVSRDITERRKAEAEHRALEDRLRQAQKMEAIGQLTGGIAHDFNNILTSVIGYLVLGQERAEQLADATLLRQLGSAQMAAQRARDLIAQMLAFARRQRGDRRLIALAPVLQQTLQLLRSTLPASIVLDSAEIGAVAALPPVRADAVQIEQVLFNLCINARDAMQRNGRITVSLRERSGIPARCASCGGAVDDGRWVEIEVTDSGCGIEPAVVQRMFEPFFSTKDVGRGTGMGLAMVHGIVHDHDGHVVVDSEPGRGTSFRVLLPAASGAAEAAPAGTRPRAAGTPLRGRVMVVDDEPMVVAFMTELLEGWGLEVVACSDPLQAVRWLEDADQALDVLITDQSMPQLTGLDLAHQVAVHRPALPVLLYSGDIEGLDDDALRRAGVRAWLAKPVDPAPLRSLLMQWLPPSGGA